MANTTAVYARVDTDIKDKAEEILSKLGISPTSAIQMFYSQVILNGGLPFVPRLPAKAPLFAGSLTNEELAEALAQGIASIERGDTYSLDEIDDMISRGFGA